MTAVRTRHASLSPVMCGPVQLLGRRVKPASDMTEISLSLAPLAPADLPAIEKLDERCFGPGRFTRTAYRLREKGKPAPELSFVARVGSLLVGANIMTHVRCEETPALLLGPLTVDPAFRSRGIGEDLMRRSLDAAKQNGHRLVLLVGDEPYYGRLGFSKTPAGGLTMPGPVDTARLLFCELVPGAFEGVSGRVRRG
jgi:predicted N-acetyltransferase YhbS